jgi:hypothetical protein
MIYNYEKEVSPDWLEEEIKASNITIALVGITLGSQTSIEFKTALSSEEKTELDSLVDDHTIKPPRKQVTEVKLNEDSENTVQLTAFASTSGFRFRGTGFSGTALANSTSDLDYTLPVERFINGGRLLIDSIGADDKLTVQVVDAPNIFGFGAGVVIDEFITDYFIPTTGNLEVRLDYPARLLQGLVLRFKYTNSESTNKVIKINLYLHMKA